MDSEITSSAMQRLIGIGKVALNDLAKRGIVVRGSKRDTYDLEASVKNYCEHLRAMAAGRGGDAGADACARLDAAQADLAEARAQRMRGGVAPVAEIEAKWTATCRSIRARVLAVADKMRDLPARQHVKLSTELHARR